MHPLIQDILSSLLRKGLTSAAASLVTWGLLTDEQAKGVVTGLVLFGLSVAWSIWQRYKDRLWFLTAIEAPPGASESDVKKAAKSIDAPSVL